jgi:hypothetical protein
MGLSGLFFQSKMSGNADRLVPFTLEDLRFKK